MLTVSTISDNIKMCQKQLDRLRKEAVVKFYANPCQNSETEQQSIHPAVKKLIGKRPAVTDSTQQYLKSTASEWKRETRKRVQKKHSTTFLKHKSKNSSKPDQETSVTNENVIRPCYIPPTIPGNPQENSAVRGNTKKMHMRVLVGNVAQKLDTIDEDGATHKWMVYVRSAPGSLEIEHQVSNACFFLHPTYKPVDIVTVSNAPFTLNRRGWGEFPLRVQLSFKNNLNQPVDIIHNLNLYGSISGHHTRSSETYLDLWLYPNGEAGPSNSITSRLILELASDLMKEHVPDFSSDLICHRCQESGSTVENGRCACDALTLSVFHDEDSSESSCSNDFIPDMITSLPMNNETDPQSYDTRNLQTPVMPVNFGMEHSSRQISNPEISSLSDIVKNVIDTTSHPNSHQDLSKSSVPYDFNTNVFEKSFLNQSTILELDLMKITDEILNNSNGAVDFSSDINPKLSEILEDLGIKEALKEEPNVFEGSDTIVKSENTGTSMLQNCSIKIEENICMNNDVSTNQDVTENKYTPPENKNYPLETEISIPEFIIPDFYDSTFESFNPFCTNNTNLINSELKFENVPATNDTNLINSELKFVNIPATNDTNFTGSRFYPLNTSSTNTKNLSDSGVVPINKPSESNTNFLDTELFSEHLPEENFHSFDSEIDKMLSEPSCSHSDSQSEHSKIITEENSRKDSTTVIEEIPIHEYTPSENNINFLDTEFVFSGKSCENNFHSFDSEIDKMLSEPSCPHSDSRSEHSKFITEENSRKDSTMAIEEIPIHEFIDNIVEEIVVDIPKEELSNSDSSQEEIVPKSFDFQDIIKSPFLNDVSPVEELSMQTQNIEEHKISDNMTQIVPKSLEFQDIIQKPLHSNNSSVIEESSMEIQHAAQNQIPTDVPSSTAHFNQDGDKVITEKSLPLSRQKPKSEEDKNIVEIVQCSKKLKYNENLSLPNMPKGGASLLESLKTNAMKTENKASTKSSVVSCLQNRAHLQKNRSGSTSLLKSKMNKNSILKPNLKNVNQSKQIKIQKSFIQPSAMQPARIANFRPSIPHSGLKLTSHLPNFQPAITTNTSEMKKPVLKIINNPRNTTIRPGMKPIRLYRVPNGVNQNNQITFPTSFIQQSRPVGVIQRPQLQNALFVARTPTNNIKLVNGSTTQNDVLLNSRLQNNDKKLTPITLVKDQVKSGVQNILLNQQGFPKNGLSVPKVDYRNKKLITKPVLKHEVLKPKKQDVKISQHYTPQLVKKTRKTDLLEMCIQKSELTDILSDLENSTPEPETGTVSQLMTSSSIYKSVLKNTSVHQINLRNNLKTPDNIEISSYQTTSAQHSLLNQKTKTSVSFQTSSSQSTTIHHGSSSSQNCNIGILEKYSTQHSTSTICSKSTLSSNSLLKKPQQIVVRNAETGSQIMKLDCKQVTKSQNVIMKTDVKRSCTKINNSSFTLKLDQNSLNRQVTTNLAKTQSSNALLSAQKYTIKIDGKIAYLQPINSSANQDSNIKCTIVKSCEGKNSDKSSTQASNLPKYIYLQKESSTTTSSYQEDNAITHASHIQSTAAEGSSVSLNVEARRLQPEISLNELIDITNFPKASAPTRPTSGSSTSTDYKYEDSQLENILSCNNLHSDLDGPNFDFGRRTVLMNRDHIGSENGHELLYYLQQHRLLVNTCQFIDMESAVRWLVRGLPLVHQHTRLLSYRVVNPYCAPTVGTFCSWPYGKRAACQWFRAKIVTRILTALKTRGVLTSKSSWSTTAVYRWAKRHGYSPAPQIIGPDMNVAKYMRQLNRKTRHRAVLNWMATVHINKKVTNEKIDVVSETQEQATAKTAKEDGSEVVDSEGVTICGQPWVRQLAGYVKHITRQIGGRLGLEPLQPDGPHLPVASTLLSHTAAFFIEDLLRRSLAVSFARHGVTVAPGDVSKAILEKPEFDFITDQEFDVSALAKYLRNIKHLTNR